VGLRLFVHAVTLVFSHVGPALRISALLYLVPAILYQVALATLLTPNLNALTSMSVASLILGLIAAVAAFWIAVGWHRYILLDETTETIVPPFRGDRILAYFGNSLLVGLIAFGIGLVVFIPLGIVAGVTAGGGGTPFFVLMLVPLIAYFIITAICYRISLILPASAIGKPITLSQAWAATSGANGTIFALAFVSVVCVLLLTLPGLWIRSNLGVLPAFIWQTVVGWVELMVGISIITTLYGHYIEKRPVP